MFQLILCLISLGLVSCSGYRVKGSTSALLENEGVRSIAIPMMINKSIYPHVSGYFTTEVIESLTSTTNIEVLSGDDTSADAILVGVISSPAREGEAITSNPSLASSAIQGATQERLEFLVPTFSEYRISIRYFLLKKPTSHDRKLLRDHGGGTLEKALIAHPSVIFNRTFVYNGTFNREVAGFGDSDSGGVVNYTKTKRFFIQSLKSMARRSAGDLRELILNVF